MCARRLERPQPTGDRTRLTHALVLVLAPPQVYRGLDMSFCSDRCRMEKVVADLKNVERKPSSRRMSATKLVADLNERATRAASASADWAQS